MVALPIKFDTQDEGSRPLWVPNPEIDKVATNANLWNDVVAVRLQHCSDGCLVFIVGLPASMNCCSVEDTRFCKLQIAFERSYAPRCSRKALQLDDSLGEAHASLAFRLEGFDWDFAAADKEFRRAVELNPGYATAHFGMSGI
jgi:hypothetical protein